MKNRESIVLAGGCFWGVEEYYRRLEGIINTEVGYAQGDLDQPTYEAVCSGQSGHVEAVKVEYNPAIISLDRIIEHLFRFIDPTQLNQQGNDIGSQYRTGLYYQSKNEKEVIERYFDSIKINYSRPIVTEIEHLDKFWPAEAYHQSYLVKNPSGYCHIDYNHIRNDELKKD